MPPETRAIRGVDDSKKLFPSERVKLASLIRERAVCWALGAASVREIEHLNIYHATTLAMRRALRRLRVAPDHVLIDGRPIRALEVPHTAIVGGDGCCYSIACASILAKVTRDRGMAALARRYPAYRWERNVGYATPAHIAGLAEHGLTPHHRRTFFRVREHADQLMLSLEPELAAAGDDTALEDLLESEQDVLNDALAALEDANGEIFRDASSGAARHVTGDDAVARDSMH